MISWFHNYLPSSVLIDLGFIEIYWYGLLLTLAVIIAFVTAGFLFKKNNIAQSHLSDLGFYLVIFCLLGARLAHVLVELPYYLDNPSLIPAFWRGGLAVHGALVMGVLVVYFYVRKHQSELFSNPDLVKDKFLKLLDILVVPVALAQAVGRWGNYFNQELYGRPTDLPWGIPIAEANRVPGYENFTHFHPTFLYESLANLALFIVLSWLLKKRSQNKTASTNRPGTIFSLYLLGYSLIRILVEFLRIDPQAIFFNLRISVVASGLLIIVAFGLMWYIKIKNGQRL